jgi:UrcA family protein
MFKVRYDDLNLANSAGTAAFQRRIRQAADRACGGRDSRDLQRAVAYQRCIYEATANALAQIDQQKANRS